MSAESDWDADSDWARVVLIVLAIAVGVPVLMMLFALPMMGAMGLWWRGGTGGFVPLWGLGMMVLWLVVLVGGGLLVLRAVSGRTTDAEDAALEELRLAYARGQFSEEEYERRRSTLRRDDE